VSSGDDKRFIETSEFPVEAINNASAKEKQGGGRPPYWEMIFWWTRKPLAGARSVIAGALLPHNIDSAEFKHYLRLNESVAHKKNPIIPQRYKEYFSRVKLLDPFAGFGSIPLEATRLGIGEVVAVELLPTAYVFLKAVLEYPKWAVENQLGQQLLRDVERWGTWITQRLSEDPDIRDLYDEDVAVYIGTWEIKCPHCGRYTPLVGNWWLARVSGRSEEIENEEEEVEEEESRSGLYTRLVWMEPIKIGDWVGIKIIDLNKDLNKKAIKAKVNTRQGIVVAEGREYRVPQPNIEARRETAICLFCNNPIRKGQQEWYVKEALRDWNSKLEQYFTGQIDKNTLINTAKARPRILTKIRIRDRDLEFMPVTDQDQDKLWRALEKLRSMWGDPDIPTELFAPYQMGTAGAFRITLWGFDKFYKLFNPRQLLTLVKLVKLIRETGKKVEEEKLREGWDREKAHKYAEAVSTYLAIALIRYGTHTSYVSPVRADTIMGAISAGALTFRGVAMVWNWCEVAHIANITGSFVRNIKSVINGLSYLVSAVSGSSSRVKVLLDDATVLSRVGDERFDLIVTDPPYRDDVPYSELSDFYYVWLKRALSDVADIGGILVRIPRFLSEAFFENGSEIEIQWKVFAPREVSEAEGRSRYFGSVGGREVGSFNYFKDLLARSFKLMASLLPDGGALVTYYAHTSPDAWEALLDAGWMSSKMRITATHALATESVQRVTARGKAGLDISIIAVWRKGVSGQSLAGEVYSDALMKCSDYVKVLLKRGFRGVDLFVGALGCVLSIFTKYEKIIGVKTTRELVENYIYPATGEAIARALGSKELPVKLSSISLFYLLSKVLIDRRPRQLRRVLDRSTATILAISARLESRSLEDLGLVERDGEKFYLLEPSWDRRDLVNSIKNVLEKKRINLVNPMIKTPIDLLHVLEYYATTLSKSDFNKKAEDFRARYPAFYTEALGVAQVLKEVLPPEDPEKELVERVINLLKPTQIGLGKWGGGGE